MDRDSLIETITSKVEREYYHNLTRKEEEDGKSFVVLYFIFGFFFAYIAYRWYNHSKWSNGKIPPTFLDNPTNTAELMIALGGNIINLEKSMINEKIQYMSVFFKKHYKSADVDIRSTFAANKAMPTKTGEILKWFVKRKSKEAKINLLYFAAGIAAVDGEIIGKEKSYLFKMCKQLKLETSHYEAILAMYAINEKEKKKTEQRKAKPSTSKKQRAFAILGLKENSSADDLKKAYRKLAKKYHPDMQQGKTDLEKSISKERFIKIQEAYDYLDI